MKSKNSLEQIIEKAERYCSMQEHCIADVHKKLYDWQADKTWFDQVIQHLIERNFINEERYAHAFVRAKFNNKGKGRNRIVMELKMKKIDISIIEEAIQEIEKDAYDEKLEKWMIKKWNQLEKCPYPERKSKTIQSMMQKGYEYDVIQKVFQKAIQQNK